MVASTSETDHLVIGAGATGMAFTDALVDHTDVHVTVVDRRRAPGGHWHDAYPFVQLHQASVFYGVASTVLGTGEVQTSGPEAGLQQRATQPEVVAYYREAMDRLIATGRVTFRGGCDHHSEGSTHLVTDLESGESTEMRVRRRVVDATYLAPTVPSTMPAPFGADPDAWVLPVNELASLDDEPDRFVIVGSGKTATDSIVWLLTNGTAPDRITWVRPREPWMLDRARVQPDPVVALGLGADTMAAAAESASLDDLFLRLESVDVVMRIDTGALPSMAKTPTLGRWELDLLRSIEDVVRLGHVRHVSGAALVLERGEVRLPPRSVIVHCAASGLVYPPVVPILGPDRIRLQTIRAGFPCFNAALAGYVEATRDDDAERNRLCPANVLPDDPRSWARMQVRGALATRSFAAEPDIAAWATGCALNPVRIDPSVRDDPDVAAAADRMAQHAPAGLARLSELSGEPLHGG